MKYYKDSADGVYGVEKPLVHVHAEWIEITKAEFDALTAPTQADVDAAARAAKDAADVATAKAYGKLTALKAMTPAQVQAWVAANVTNLAQAQDAIATLAIGVSVLARRI